MTRTTRTTRTTPKPRGQSIVAVPRKTPQNPRTTSSHLDTRVVREFFEVVRETGPGPLTWHFDGCAGCAGCAGRSFTPLEVLIPAAAPRPLPTLDASLRVLGRVSAALEARLDDQG